MNTDESKPAVQLYHFWSSVCSVRCRMALEEKGVKWESKYIDLFKFDQLTPEYLAINPDGVVPTLAHNGSVVRELVIINEYIDAAFPGPHLIPSDPLAAARMRLFIRTCETALAPVALLTYVKYILPKLRNRWSDEELRAQADKRPTKFLRDLHSRGIRGEITADELDEATRDVETLLDDLEARTRSGTLGGWRLLPRGRGDRSVHVSLKCVGPGPFLVGSATPARSSMVSRTERASGLSESSLLAR